MLIPGDFPNIVSALNKTHTLPDDIVNVVSGSIPTFKDAEMNYRKMYFESLWKKYGPDVNRISAIAGITPQATRRILKKLGLR